MKFSGDKYEVQKLEVSDWEIILGTDWIRENFAKKTKGPGEQQAGSRTWVNSAHLWQWGLSMYWDALGGFYPEGHGRWLFPSSQHSWVHICIMVSSLHPPMQEKYWKTVVSLKEDHWDDWRVENMTCEERGKN